MNSWLRSLGSLGFFTFAFAIVRGNGCRLGCQQSTSFLVGDVSGSCHAQQAGQLSTHIFRLGKSHHLSDQRRDAQVLHSVGVQVELAHHFRNLISEVLRIAIEERILDVGCYAAVVHKAVDCLSAFDGRSDLVEELSVATDDVDASGFECFADNASLALGDSTLSIDGCDFDILFFVQLQLELFVIFSDSVQDLHGFRLLSDALSFAAELL